MQVSPRRFIASSFTLSVVLERRSFSMSTFPLLQLIPFSSNIKICSSLKTRYVRIPRTEAEIESCMREYNEAGMPGCIGSADATHIALWMCSANFKQLHTGFKDSHPTRAFNITVNHRRRILYTTKGHPGRWNDKTLILYDDFLRGIYEGRLYSDVEFDLSSSINGERHTRKYKGVWIMVDNGYLRCPSHRQQYCHY